MVASGKCALPSKSQMPGILIDHRHWNCYPGARVDSMVPVYEYSIEKIWKVSSR